MQAVTELKDLVTWVIGMVAPVVLALTTATVFLWRRLADLQREWRQEQRELIGNYYDALIEVRKVLGKVAESGNSKDEDEG